MSMLSRRDSVRVYVCMYVCIHFNACGSAGLVAACLCVIGVFVCVRAHGARACLCLCV